MSSNNEGVPSDKKLREVSNAVSMSTNIKMPVEDNSNAKESALQKPATQFVKQKIKEEKNTGDIEDDIIYEGDVTQTKEIKPEKLDYSGNSEYIEDETGFEDISYPPMEIDESVGYGFEGYVHPIHYKDVIDDDLNDIDEDSKDDDPDFGQKKKKKKKVPIDTLLEDQIKSRRIAKPKILECTDDLTKIDHCEDNPNFAVVVDFIEKFGDHLGQKKIPIKDLQSMISDHENEPHSDLIKLHTNLLRKTKLPKKTLITKKTWENALILFCHTTGGMVGEGLELQKLGYAQISLSLRLEILKNLMESQFDWNERIRMLVDDLPVEALRHEPTGKDIEGKIYWTQIDDHAEIRIYTEDYRHDTWGNVVQNRVELVSLLDKLKDEKLYKQEVEKLKVLEADVQDQNAVVHSIAEMEKEQEVKLDGFNTEYRCEVCKLEFGTKVELMEHYSGGHMLFKLKEKFRHLVENGKCKICKFEAENEKLIWIHIGASHEKVNSVLKESKLKPIGDSVKNCNEEKTNPEIREIPKPKVDSTTLKEDNAIINKLEKKIEELQYEMIDGDQPMAELTAAPKVQNNQESEEVLSMREGVEIRKVNLILNLDGITDLEEDEVKPEASEKLPNDNQTEENCETPKTTKGKKGKNVNVNVKEKVLEEETGAKGKRGRKRKADTQTVQNLEEDSKSVELKVDTGGKNTEDKSKVSNSTPKQKETKSKVEDEGNDSVERPRRGRACKEIAEVLKVADIPTIKRGKEKKAEKEDSNKPVGKGSKEKKNEKELKEESNKKDIKEESKKEESKKEESKKEDTKEENPEKNTKDDKNEKNKKGRSKKEEDKKEEDKKVEIKKEDNKKEEDKKEEIKKVENKRGGKKKEENKKEGTNKPVNKRGSKKEENVKDINLESKEQDEAVTPVKDEKNEKKKRGRNTTPKKGNAPNTNTATEVKEEHDVKPEVTTEDTKDPKDQNKKRRAPAKKAAKVTAEKQGGNEPILDSTKVDDVAQKVENSLVDKIAKGSQSKRATPKKVQKETNNKNKKNNDESTTNEEKPDIKTETKAQGKRKETGDETEKQTKKKKLEQPSLAGKNVRERKSRNVKKPDYDDSDLIMDEDFIPEDSIQSEESVKAPKENKGKNKKKLNEVNTEIKQVEDVNGSKQKVKKPRQKKTKEEKKVIDLAKEMKVKKRRENKLSCKKCNQWKDGKESVFQCSNCEQGWHQHCAIPPLYHEPEPDWLCPLCHHVALVKKLEKTLSEFDILMERAEERRLADLIENQSRVTDDQYDDLNDYSYSGEKVLINVQVNPPVMKDIMRPDYYESSDEDAPESDDDEWGVGRTAACTCEGDGDCVYCKRMQGCTCGGHGTCRLCQAKSEKGKEKGNSKPGPQKMSTTEMFMMTGKSRQTEVQAHERTPVDGFRFRGTARGRFMPRRMRRGRGGRGTGMGRGQPQFTTSTLSTPPTPSIGKNLPPGITITSTPVEKKPFASLGIGRSLPPGITVMDSSGKDISHLTPKARAPVPELNLPGISLSRANEAPTKVIDIIDLSDSDDEPEILTPPPSMAVVPYRPLGQTQSRPYAPGQGGPRVPGQLGGRMQMQRRPMPPGMRRPMGGMMRPRVPLQQGGRIIVQNRARPGAPFQRGNMIRRGGPPQRGSYPMQRGPSIEGQRGAFPAQRRPIPVRGGMRPMRPGMRPMQRGGPPGQRRFGGPPRPGMRGPPRPGMRRPMGRIMPGGMRPRGPMTRPPQGGMGRGPRPMMRMRGRPMPRPQLTKQPDIVIPTVTPGHDPSLDMDIVADNADIPNVDGQDDRGTGSPFHENLSRLPQFIQVQKVYEYDLE